MTNRKETTKQTARRSKKNNKESGIPDHESMASILEWISDGFVAFDAQMNYTYVNERSGQLLGRKPKDLIGKNYWKEYPQAKGTPFADAYVRALETQTPIFFEDYYAPWDRWFENRIYPSKDGLAVFFTEITERKKVEEALREQERFISAIANTSPAIVYVFDMATQSNVYSNTGIERLLGYSPKEVQAMGAELFVRLIHPDDLAEVIAFQSKILDAADEDILEIQYRMKHQDGQWRDFHSYERPFLRNKDGSLKQKVGIAIDITERKRAEDALRESEEKFSKIFYASPVPVSISDLPDGRFVDVNESFLKRTGFQREEVIGRTALELDVRADPAEREEMMQIIREQGSLRNFEVRFKTKSGEVGTTLLSGDIIELGGEKHLVGTSIDITEIRRAEEEIRKLNQELEQRVAERTAQLQTANKDLESFSYSVSHDLRAPLRAISGFAEIIARRHRASLNEEGQHYFDNIVQASERMGHLIDDLLTYSRIGRGAVRRESISLTDVLTPLIRDFAARLKDIGGRLEIANDLPTVIGDKTLFNQVFTNLLENAFTYRKADAPPQINVTWHMDGKAVIIRVSDNGIGIPTEYHQKIFSIFQRLHSEDDYPGTGIGLATVKKSVDLLGGSVWVESEAGSGSNFFIKLPKE